MKKIDCCGNCVHFDSNNDKLGICTNYESDRIGYLLSAKHYCNKYTVSDDIKEIINNLNSFARANKYYEK